MTEAKINLTTGEFECGFVNLASPNKFGNYGVEMILPDSSAELKAITTANAQATATSSTRLEERFQRTLDALISTKDDPEKRRKLHTFCP